MPSMCKEVSIQALESLVQAGWVYIPIFSSSSMCELIFDMLKHIQSEFCMKYKLKGFISKLKNLQYKLCDV
jgi:hypothetical protein